MKFKLEWRYRGPLGWLVQVFQWCRLMRLEIEVIEQPKIGELFDELRRAIATEAP